MLIAIAYFMLFASETLPFGMVVSPQVADENAPPIAAQPGVFVIPAIQFDNSGKVVPPSSIDRAEGIREFFVLFQPEVLEELLVDDAQELLLAELVGNWKVEYDEKVNSPKTTTDEDARLSPYQSQQLGLARQRKVLKQRQADAIEVLKQGLSTEQRKRLREIVTQWQVTVQGMKMLLASKHFEYRKALGLTDEQVEQIHAVVVDIGWLKGHLFDKCSG